jgi:hypothetical protein
MLNFFNIFKPLFGVGWNPASGLGCISWAPFEGPCWQRGWLHCLPAVFFAGAEGMLIIEVMEADLKHLDADLVLSTSSTIAM